MAKLESSYNDFTELSFPRVGNTKFDDQLDELISDIQVDMAGEDGYLAGIVDTYLKCKRINAKEISIDSSIDARIDQAINSFQEGKEILQNFKGYRKKMLDLAESLSNISGVPLRKKE